MSDSAGHKRSSLGRHTLGAVGTAFREKGVAGAQLLWDGYHPIVESDHSKITQDGLAGTGLESATETIEDYVDDVDWDSYWWPRSRYFPAGHFDRPQGMTSGDAYLAGVTYVSTYRSATLSALALASLEGQDTSTRRKAIKHAARSLGVLLHARQDAYAHSNFLDLPSHVQAEFQRVLETGLSIISAELTQLVKLTGYDIDAPKPGRPPNDDYAHDDHAVGHGNQGDDKMQAAWRHAVEDTRHAVISIRRSLGELVGNGPAETVWCAFAQI